MNKQMFDSNLNWRPHTNIPRKPNSKRKSQTIFSIFSFSLLAIFIAALLYSSHAASLGILQMIVSIVLSAALAGAVVFLNVKVWKDKN